MIDAEQIHPAPTPEKRLLDTLGIEVRKTPQSGERFGGFIILKGPLENVIEVVVQITKLGAYPGHRQQAVERQIRRALPRGINNLDLNIPGEGEETKMVRLNSRARQETLEIEFGGGGNHTTFSEMDFAVTAATKKTLEQQPTINN